MTVLLLILIALISYYLGSLNGAIIAARFVFHRDVRNYGSGNAGLTNYYRSFGVPGMVLLLCIDVLKSMLAILIGGALMRIADARLVGRLFAGFCLMLGHCFPAYYGFRGGKGVLCAAVMLLMADWRVGLCSLLVFAVTVIFTRYVSLGSILAAVLAPIFTWIFGHSGLEGTLVLFCTLLILLRHWQNILRLCRHTESRLKRPSAGTLLEEEEFRDP